MQGLLPGSTDWPCYWCRRLRTVVKGVGVRLVRMESSVAERLLFRTHTLSPCAVPRLGGVCFTDFGIAIRGKDGS